MRTSSWNCASRPASRCDAGGQELQRDRLAERQVVGAVHLAHAAAAEQRDDAVAAGDDRPGREAVRRRRRAVTGSRVRRARRRFRGVDRQIVVTGADTRGFYWRTRMTRKLIATMAAVLGHGRPDARAGLPFSEPDGHGGDPGRRQSTCRAERRRSTRTESGSRSRTAGRSSAGGICGALAPTTGGRSTTARRSGARARTSRRD